MTPNTLSYRGYVASVEFDSRDGLFWGKVLGLIDRITFEGETVKELTGDFHRAIDFYLEDCAKTGRAAEQPLSGDLTLHVDPEMHGAVLAAARAAGKSPDQWAAEIFADAVGK
ncbi:type II toxin-antitoxin system HicB family antitoxin [Endothiovibrio diazotrophicus]